MLENFVCNHVFLANENVNRFPKVIKAYSFFLGMVANFVCCEKELWSDVEESEVLNSTFYFIWS